MPKKKNKEAGKEIRDRINGIYESEKINEIINKISGVGLSKLSKEELELMFEKFKKSLPKKLRKSIKLDLEHRDE